MCRSKLGLQVQMGEEGIFNFKFYSFDLNYKRSHVSGEKKRLYYLRMPGKTSFIFPKFLLGAEEELDPRMNED